MQEYPGKKYVVIEVYYGASEPIIKDFVVDAKTDMDVYIEASRQCKLVAEQKGHDAIFDIISIEPYKPLTMDDVTDTSSKKAQEEYDKMSDYEKWIDFGKEWARALRE